MKSAARPIDQPARLLTEAEAADRCRYMDRGCANPVRAFQKWARRSGVPVKYVGRTRLYDPRVLDAFMEREAWTKRHKVHVPHSARPVRVQGSEESSGAR